MIIEDIVDYTEKATSLAESIHNLETEADRKEREQVFVVVFSKYINSINVLSAMLSVMPITIKGNEVEVIKAALQSGQRVYKNLQISNAVPINSIRDAVDTLEKIKNKWKKQYLVSEEVKETLSMLELIMPIYKGTPKPKELIDNIQAVDDETVDVEKINEANQSVEKGREILNNMEIDEDVKTFLKKVSTNSASLMDVNENILHWLKNNDMLNKMRVTNL